MAVSANSYNAEVNYMFELFILPLGFDAVLYKVTSAIILKLCVLLHEYQVAQTSPQQLVSLHDTYSYWNKT